MRTADTSTCRERRKPPTDSRRRLEIDFESHDCRRTLATYLDRADFPEKKTAALVNHREALEGSTLRVAYIERNYDDWKREAIDALDDDPLRRAEDANPVVAGRSKVLRFAR